MKEAQPFTFYLFVVKEETDQEKKVKVKAAELKEEPNEEPRPSRHDFATQAEWAKAFKLWEIARGDYKPTRRDFKDEDELKKQIEIYNMAIKKRGL